MEDIDNSWCQLVCSTDVTAPILKINKDSFIIGRSKDCDLCITDNTLISGHHCRLFRGQSGEVWLEDNSTNGTLINLLTRVSKGQKHKLQHGDEIFIVYKKNNNNVAYLYQDIVELRKQELEDSSLHKTDLTVEYDTDSENETSPIQRSDVEQVSRPAMKRIKLDDVIEPVVDSEPVITSKPEITGEPEITRESVAAGDLGASELEAAGQTISPQVGSCEGVSGAQVTKEEHAAGPSRLNDDRDDMEETLLCSICQDILHNAICLQPCLHTFCAGCYSSWMMKSTECPSCRNKVDRISYNHIVKNLVDVYLKGHPEKRKSDDEIRELDAKNKITNDMLHPGLSRKKCESFDSSYSDDSNSGSDYSDGLFSLQAPPRSVCRQCPTTHQTTVSQATPTAGKMITSTTAACAVTSIAAPTTAACAVTSVAAPTTATVPSNSSAQPTATLTRTTPSGEVVTMPTAPEYSCGANDNHLVCVCCLEPMPDRRNERGIVPNLPPQQCENCSNFYCHMYWGCSKPHCLGCQNKLKDFKFGRRSLETLINNNRYESEVLKNFISSRNLTYVDLIHECLQRMDSSLYRLQAQYRIHIHSSSVLCYSCGLAIFKELAYMYRKDIPRDQLPSEVINRPNCYWGRNCRTQMNKPHHARNFNHICDQTRY